MSEHGQRPRIEPSVPPRRDDTPSFIRNVDSRREVLHPGRGEYHSVIPVMEVPRSIRIWRMVRWPLFALGVLIALVIIGLVTNDILESRSVARRIEDARKGESLGAIETVLAAGKALSELASEQPDRKNAQAAWAWHAVLEATWFGPREELVRKAKDAIAAADTGDPSTVAARIGVACLENDLSKIEALLSAAKEESEPRLSLARAWFETAQGEPGKALGTLEAAFKQHSSYVPLVVEGMRTAFLVGDAAQATLWLNRLRDILPDHLWASLVQVALSLPKWGESSVSREAENKAVSVLDKLAPRIDAAPPLLRIFGLEIKGRAQLAASDLDRASETFSKVLELAPTGAHLAWRALTALRKDGPRVALELLEKRPDLTGPQVLDVRAQALLAWHRVEDARPVVEELAKSGEFGERVRTLEFVLAVREGAVDAALGRFPERLTPQLVWPALELHEQAAALGREKAVGEIIDAVSEVDDACGDALRAWHGKSDREAIRVLRKRSETSSCAAALRARELFGRDDPKQVLESAQRVYEATEHGLWAQVVRGLAVYLLEGREAGLAALDAVAAVSPQGTPLRVALGRAYLRLGAPDKATAVIEGDDSDAALALRIDASPEKGKDALIARAASRYEDKPTPQRAYFAALALQRLDKHAEAVAIATAAAPEAGAFGARLGALAARSLSLMGDKREADKLLEQLGRSLRGPAGFGAAWDAKTELVLLNLKRAGKYTFRALGLIGELTSQGVRSADLLYAFAMANIAQGNERGAPRFLREALELDPSHVQTCQQLLSMGKLEDDLRAACLKARPDLQL